MHYGFLFVLLILCYYDIHIRLHPSSIYEMLNCEVAALIGNCFFLGHSDTKCGPPHSKQPLLTIGVCGDVVVLLVDDGSRLILLVQLVRDGSP